jgi:hypothetical protein
MPASGLTSVSEHLQTTCPPCFDYVNGLILERSMPAWKPADLGRSFVASLRTPRKVWDTRPVPECRLQVAPARFRIPGLYVILGRNRQQPILRRQARTQSALFRTENPEIVVPLDAVFEF